MTGILVGLFEVQFETLPKKVDSFPREAMCFPKNNIN